MEMEKTNFKVKGNILNEFSKNIPDYFTAINELIKNSFDADSKNVFLNFDFDNDTFEITDDGIGMKKSDIDNLLHISNSTKTFSSMRKNGRYTQGSKGLGFYSLFKMGNTCIIETKSDGSVGYSINLNFDELEKSDNITDIVIPLESSSSINKGTSIKVDLTSESKEILINNLNDKVFLNKILYSFQNNKNFNINIQIGENSYTNSSLEELIDNFNEHQILKVEYSSKEEKIKYFLNNSYYDLVGFHPKEYLPEGVEVNVNLSIFYFTGKKTKDFKNKYSLFTAKNGDLSPLVYFNDNLFNNDTIFDTNIVRKTSSKSALPQIAGILNIYSKLSSIEFNSDRTNFTESPETISIKKFIEELNIFIQTNGAKIKECLPAEGNKYLSIDSFLKKINSENLEISDIYSRYNKFGYKEFLVKDKNNKYILKNNNIESNAIEHKSNVTENDSIEKSTNLTENNFKESYVEKLSSSVSKDNVKIILTKNSDNIEIFNNPVNLLDYVLSTKNNETEFNKNDLDILLNGELLDSKKVPIIKKEETLTIVFKYKDLATEKLILNFNGFNSKKSKKINNKRTLLRSSIISGISYSEIANNIFHQINTLDIGDYKEIISSSLRSLVELSIESILKNKLTGLSLNKKGCTEDNLSSIINFLNNKTTITSITNSKITHISYQQLRNMLDCLEKASFIASTLNLAAHKSSSYITSSKLEEVSLFISILVLLAEYAQYEADKK